MFSTSSNNNSPIQYQKGYVEFYKLKFKVSPDVLIPRPETELLVDEVLKSIKDIEKEDILIVDVGTGAGNIAISIAKNTPSVKLIATDISKKALRIAKQNAKLHGVENKIKFIQSDLLNVIARNEVTKQSRSKNSHTKIASLASLRLRSHVKDGRSGLITRNDNNVDIIVTNLPYIPSVRIPYLDSSVKDFEPHIALDGGEDGFELYRKLFQQIKQLSTPGVDLKPHSRCGYSKPKLIICEIDYTHGELAANETQKYFPKAEIEVKKDLAHLQRILTIKFDI